MLHNYLQSYIDSNVFADFKSAAESYCTYLENLAYKEKEKFPVQLKTLLADLYATALKLPEVDLVIDGDYEDKTLRDNLKNITAGFGNVVADILGKDQFYRTVYHPDNIEKEEIAHGFLIDDIQDIYLDIKEPLEFLKTNDNSAVQQAIWDIKFSLRSHWGEHCVAALHFLQYLCLKYE